ncbi:MAG: TetR/AcrR family transcriptional regulator [Firmicutes bacterium]|nr:TetR/AcrR family transcriptional regulator [Bacillota bacterium]
MFFGDEKKSLLFKAALEVFAEKGFANATVDEIVQRAGVAKGTVYHHFESKEELFLVLLQTGTEYLVSEAQEELLYHSEAAERLQVVIERYIRFLGKYKEFFKVLLTEIWWVDDRWKEQVQNLRQEMLKPLITVIGEAQERGIIRKDVAPENLAPALFGLITHETLHWTLFKDAFPYADILRTVKVIFFEGTLARKN